MNSPTPPDSDEALAALDPIRPILWEALEHGIATARAHFTQGPVNGSLGSHIARFHAREHLVANGVECEHLALNGIGLKYGGYYIRVLKADDGELPVAGSSVRRQRFYCQLPQQQELFAVEAGDVEIEPEVNLVVLWDVVRGSFNGLSLALACPKAGGTTKASVEAHWYREFQHPAFDGHASGDDFDDLDIGDLGEEGTNNDPDDDE